MKIAIPTETDTGLDSLRSINFAHAPFYTIVTFDDDMNQTDVEVVPSLDLSEVTREEVVDHIADLGVDGIIAIGMSMDPFLRFVNAGVIPYCDDRVPTAGEVADRFAAGEVYKMCPSCRGRGGSR